MTAEVYDVLGQDNAPDIPQGASPVLTVNVPNIDFQWGGGDVLGGPSEDVIVRFTGSIISNTTQNISFLAAGDDGTKLYLDGVLITDDWFDKGGGGTISAPVSFTAGVPKSITLMYYENGGGANVFLYWDQSGSMDIIPSSAFTSQAAASPTPVITPVVKEIGPPRNLTASDNGSGIVLSWEAPNTGNVSPERYAINFSANGGGWGIATGNVGDANALNTTITIQYSTLESLKPSGTTWTFSIRSDNDTESLYSATSNQVNLKVGKTQEEKDAEAAAELAAQQELARQTAANIAISTYESQTILNLEEIAIAENLKILADSATAIVLNANIKTLLQSRIDAKTSTVLSTKEVLIKAKLEAEAAAKLAAEREAARIAAEQEAARQAALAEAERVEAEKQAAIKAEEDRLAAEAAAKAEEERIAAEEEAKRLEEERIAAEEAAKKAEEEAQAEAERIEAEEKAQAEADEKERLEAEAKEKAESEAKDKAEKERLEAEEDERAKAKEEAAKEEEKLDKILEEAASGKELSKEEIAAVVTSLVSELKPGESLSAAEIKASGVSFADLPPDTPVEIRISESGEPLIITAEVAAQVELVSDPGALAAELFNDPGAAIAALGSIGADMTPGEREEATKMVVATVVATGAALNAVGLATGGSAPSAPSGGSSSGTNSSGARRNERW